MQPSSTGAWLPRSLPQADAPRLPVPETGQAYLREAYKLHSFDSYVAEHHRGQGSLDWQGLVSGWSGRRPVRKSSTVRGELAKMRQFCLFRRRYDPGGSVPERGWGPSTTDLNCLPEVLSASQVAEPIHRTGQLKDRPLRRSGMRVLICTLCSTGLRLGEASRLRWADVHWKERCFLIRMSKGRTNPQTTKCPARLNMRTGPRESAQRYLRPATQPGRRQR